MVGTVKGGSLIPAEIAAFVTFVWMCVQREQYVGESYGGGEEGG